MELLQKVILSIGLNDKNEHKQVIEDLTAHDLILKAVSRAGINGATLTTGLLGVYEGEKEKSCQLVLYDVEFAKVEKLCELLKVALNQQCIAVEIIKNVDVKFL